MPRPARPALQLECGAATAFDQLNTAFKAAIGQNIGITDGYRSYDEQVACRSKREACAPTPAPPTTAGAKRFFRLGGAWGGPGAAACRVS